ncbi:MAG: TatD family hydrolase [Planctomycetota bacterium]|nr:TatD family hydrolase [Planctomycetota bacterium]
MTIIEPHIHMYSRTTDDYQAMYAAGIRACVEPSFWLGANRRYAGTFFDYFRLILEFETVRARRFGIDHYAAISMNPKEAEDRRLVDEVLAGMGEYLDHQRCVALGEIGFNNITDNEEYTFGRQLEIAKDRNMPVVIHLPHFNKPEGIERTMKVVHQVGFDESKIYLDHNTEQTIARVVETGCYAGLTVYPISKLTPERVSKIVRRYGCERIIVSGSADWGVSDPLALVKVVDYMKNDGHGEDTIRRLVFGNATAFYSLSPNWKPEFDIKPMDPHEFQR